jgi:hypothetical protein
MEIEVERIIVITFDSYYNAIVLVVLLPRKERV